MPITQILLTANTTGGGGGGGGGGSGVYPVTLAATGGSMYFANTGYKLEVTDTLSDFTVGTGDYTVEWWQWMLDTSSPYARPFSMGNWPSSKLSLSLENGTGYLWGEGAGGFNNQVGSFSYTPTDLHDTWTHIAVSRVSGTTRVFFNGVAVFTTGNSYNVVTQDNFVIGNQYIQDAGFVGYMKDFRFIKGVGLYSSTFTPPEAPLTATAETKLLLAIENVLSPAYDSSASAHNPGNAGVVGVDVGPYDLALHVDASNASSYTVGDTAHWFDLSAANNDLDLTNTTYSSNYGGVLNFGTTGGAISPSSIGVIQNGLTPRASISFWAVVTLTGGYQHMAGMRGEDKFYMLMLGYNVVECRVETTNGFWDNLPDASTRIGNMTHYAFVANGDRTDTYINGVLIQTVNSIIGTYRGTLGALSIANVNGAFQATNLQIGELRYYNRARSPKEIAAEFAATRSRYGV